MLIKKNNMNKTLIRNKYENHYLVTLLILFLILFLSILPILPISVYVGLEDRRIPLYETQVQTYYSYLFSSIETGTVLSFLYAFGMIAFYVSSFGSVIYILLADKKNAKIWLLICALSHILGIVTLSYISIFSTISFTLTISLLIVDYYFDHQRSVSEKALLENKRKQLNRLGQIIKERRIEKGLTQQALADKVFVSRTLIAKIENGSYLVNDDLLKNISIVLGVELDNIE